MTEKIKTVAVKKVGDYELSIRVKEISLNEYQLIVTSFDSKRKRSPTEWTVPHDGGFTQESVAQRMSGYILRGIDRVGHDGKPNFGVV
jgi:hypothetical protein